MRGTYRAFKRVLEILTPKRMCTYIYTLTIFRIYYGKIHLTRRELISYKYSVLPSLYEIQHRCPFRSPSFVRTALNVVPVVRTHALIGPYTNLIETNGKISQRKVDNIAVSAGMFFANNITRSIKHEEPRSIQSRLSLWPTLQRRLAAIPRLLLFGMEVHHRRRFCRSWWKAGSEVS